ncbi:hypothetical protein Unana1_04486 [Umbelopsis nana]
MPTNDDSGENKTITNNHVGYEGLTDEEADKVSYWADWVELNAVAPPQPPRPPPNFSNAYPAFSDATKSTIDQKAKL